MKFLVFSPPPSSNLSIAETLLHSEFERFLSFLSPELRQLQNDFPIVNNEAQLRLMVKKSKEITTVLCFCFPHDVPLNLGCQIVVAMPFFFDAINTHATFPIPIEQWPEQLSQVDAIIVPTQHVKNSVEQALLLPVPVYVLNINAESHAIDQLVAAELKEIQAIEIAPTMFVSAADGPWNSTDDPPSVVTDRFAFQEWDGKMIGGSFGGDFRGELWPIGFFPNEKWGIWSDSVHASIALPTNVGGRFQLKIGLIGTGVNVDREILVQVGNSQQKVILRSILVSTVLEFDLTEPANRVYFEGYDLDFQEDTRGLGVGVSDLQITRVLPWEGASLVQAFGNSQNYEIWPIGFFPNEGWGIWANSLNASLVLPKAVSGKFRLKITMMACGDNAGQPIEIRIGNSKQSVAPIFLLQTFLLDFEITEPANRVYFSGYALDCQVDSRGLGVGVSLVEIYNPTAWIERSGRIIRSLVNKIRKKNISKEQESFDSPRDNGPTLLLEGKIFLMHLHPIDLMFENWKDVVVTYATALQNHQTANLVVVCTGIPKSAILPLVAQFFDRIQPLTTPVHFVFFDKDQQAVSEILNFQDLVLINRSDGLDLNHKFTEQMLFTIGPNADDSMNNSSAQPTFSVGVQQRVHTLVYGHFLPLALTNEFVRDELSETFRRAITLITDKNKSSSHRQVNATQCKQQEKIAQLQSLLSPLVNQK